MKRTRLLLTLGAAAIVGCGAILGIPDEDPAQTSELDAGFEATTTPPIDAPLADAGTLDADAEIDAILDCGLSPPSFVEGPHCPPLGATSTCKFGEKCCPGDGTPGCYDAGNCGLKRDKIECEVRAHCGAGLSCCLAEYDASASDLRTSCSIIGHRTLCRDDCVGTVELCSPKKPVCSSPTQHCVAVNMFYPELGPAVQGICR